MECFILAGGQSRRFGEDKILFRIGSRRTVEYVIETARKVCDRVALVVKERERFRDIGVEVLEDLLPDRTPLAGILTALKSAEGSRALILGGDMPLIKEEVLRLLMEEFREPVTLFRTNRKVQTLVGVYSKGITELMEEYMKMGGRSVIGFLEVVGFKVIPEERLKEVDPELVSFTNLNTKEDLRTVLERIGWT
ncbi:MAG: molybdenum cofactor guanylyltransferase MobA [Aquificota bacterium]|nr:molybdenum cofactor guanylyltransferase MobA [Aquificota bacterium]